LYFHVRKARWLNSNPIQVGVIVIVIYSHFDYSMTQALHSSLPCYNQHLPMRVPSAAFFCVSCFVFTV
jgi:hypothetical protein